MKDAFQNWPAIARRLSGRRKRLLLFDFDGTLAPIAPTPGQARLPRTARTSLKKLSLKKGCVVGVISGRAINDVARKIKLKNIVLAGNHGLEIKGAGFSFTHPAARKARPMLKRLAARARADFKNRKGFLVEDKKWGVSLHYRRTKGLTAPYLERWLETIQKNEFRGARWRILFGKKVLEIRPPVAWDKGNAVKYFQKRLGRSTALFFMGDDQTDERAFSVVKKSGVAVRVGRGRFSRASYFISGPAQTPAILKRLLTL